MWNKFFRLRPLLFFPAVGFIGTSLAAACSLLIQGVTGKRITWSVVLVVAAVIVGFERGRRDEKADNRSAAP